MADATKTIDSKQFVTDAVKNGFHPLVTAFAHDNPDLIKTEDAWKTVSQRLCDGAACSVSAETLDDAQRNAFLEYYQAADGVPTGTDADFSAVDYASLTKTQATVFAFVLLDRARRNKNQESVDLAARASLRLPHDQGLVLLHKLYELDGQALLRSTEWPSVATHFAKLVQS